MMQLAAKLEQNCVLQKKNASSLNFIEGDQRRNNVCYNCGKPGHISVECRKDGQRAKEEVKMLQMLF